MLNKILYSCFVCLIITVLTNTQGQRLPHSEKIERYFYYKCFNRTRDLLTFQKLYNDTTLFIGRTAVAAQLLPDKKVTFCNIERKYLATGIEQVSKDLLSCLDPGEKHLSDFLESFVKGFLHFLCHNNGENMERLFNDGKTCIENTVNSYKLEPCFAKIFPPLSDKGVSKKELCDNMDVVRKCFNIVLTEKCAGQQFMHALNEKFFKYVGRTCSASFMNYLNTLLTGDLKKKIDVGVHEEKFAGVQTFYLKYKKSVLTFSTLSPGRNDSSFEQNTSV